MKSEQLSNFRNFLATDKVPETIFGYPVVHTEENYTENDIQFFAEHPKAAGFYDLGQEEMTEMVPQQAEKAQGTSRYVTVKSGDSLSKISKATGVPVDDLMRYSKIKDANKIQVGQKLLLTEPYPGSWNNPGNVQMGTVAYTGESGAVKGKVSTGKFLTFKTPEDGLNAMGQVINQIRTTKIPAKFHEGKLTNDAFTVSNLINTYAPSEDNNDTEDYIKFVEGRLGVSRDTELNIDDTGQMTKLFRAIITRDSSPKHAEWYLDSDYENAVRVMKDPTAKRTKWWPVK